MALVAVRSKAVALLLLIHSLLMLPLFVGFFVWFLFCYVVLSIFSSFEIIFSCLPDVL